MRDVATRVTWLLGIIAALLVGMGMQLYRLSISQSVDWRTQAEQNMRRVMSVHGPRGSIYDRKGRALAVSVPAFAAVLVKQDPTYVEEILPQLSLVLAGGDPAKSQEIADFVRRRVKEHKELGRQYEPITIARKLDKAVVSTFIERRSEFAGVLLVTESARSYPGGKFAGALIGYVGAISSDQMSDPVFHRYTGDEVVGKDGLELFYERYLQGTSGERSVVVDPWGRPMSDLEETPPTPGNNLTLTLDLDLQKAAEEALIKQMNWIKKQNDPEGNPIRGALVVQNVRTGAILAMASVPTFDPNLFVSGMTDAQWRELSANPGLPMQNWDLQGFAPGSTYKMAVGLAGLQGGALSAYEPVDCRTQYWRYHQPKNWYPLPQGPADVARALAISCDPYFYEVGHLMGIDRLAAFNAQFGFGQKTGIDLPGESAGVNPTRQTYADRWMPGNVLSVAIGQGDVLTTPLQLANYTATVAAGGVRYRPYLVSEVHTPAGDLVLRREPEQVGMVNAERAYWERVQAGMRLAVTSPEGTANRPFQGFPVAVAAKTGSAETGFPWANALTVAYAPYDKPEIAVSVLIEGGAHGSWVSPAARVVMAEYFGIKETLEETWINKTD